MNSAYAIGASFLAVLGFVGLRVPIAFALILGAVAGLFLVYGWYPGEAFDPEAALRPMMSVLADVPFRFVHSYELSTIPLYILLGAVAHKSGITTDVFRSMRVLLGRMPGGLAVACIFGCGGFSALSGSSLACAAAMGRISIPEMIDNGYDRRLAAGTVAMGGTVGSMIPPSIPFLLFAILAEVSVGQLLLAGILPGLLTLLGYVITVQIWVRLRPEAAPGRAVRVSGRDMLGAILGLWPATLLFAIIAVGIFTGLFTTIQSAAVSVIAATLIGIARGALRLSDMYEALEEAVSQSAQLFIMAFGAKVLITLVAASDLTSGLIGWTQHAGLEPWQIMAAIIVLFLILGMFLDPSGILLLMVPITLPIVSDLGYDLIWYAVIVVKLLEIGLVTPPMGLNAFMVNASVPRSHAVDLREVFAGIAPFLVLEAVVTGLLLGFPIISLLIPGMM
ncbi:TRAP transporter large permease [uncultured Tistrella sp.]|uniref:TRAP transporter large permease n=1 Tax=Tistrella mobilis TaxID=171437 RepID=UPI000C0ACB84|nr:TRAP transporter large permease [uncultured Tistrella sp.]MAM72404.1 C4-dicarboxylate ABC transporter permease [Tistrella sp.]